MADTSKKEREKEKNRVFQIKYMDDGHRMVPDGHMEVEGTDDG